MYKFALDTPTTSSGDLKCCFKTYAAPQYIVNNECCTRPLHPELFLIEHDTKTTPITFKAGTLEGINSADFNLVPSRNHHRFRCEQTF
jgi:hypothetical protein